MLLKGRKTLIFVIKQNLTFMCVRSDGIIIFPKSNRTYGLFSEELECDLKQKEI